MSSLVLGCCLWPEKKTLERLYRECRISQTIAPCTGSSTETNDLFSTVIETGERPAREAITLKGD